MTKFTYNVDTRRIVHFTDGSYLALGGDRERADWVFDDGVEVHVTVDPWYKTHYYRTGRPYQERVKATHGRTYVSCGEVFDVMEDLENRRRRPHNVWKPRVKEALARIGLEPEAMHWNQRAGCGCGCSPGFVTQGVPGNITVWVVLPGAPTV